MNNFKRMISPSLLSADFSKINGTIHELESAGANRLHIDVMDGNFVPNITFGPIVIKGIRKISKSHFECHLMINNPEKYIAEFANAGADTIIIHQEASHDLVNDLLAIKKCGCLAGVSINPDTDIDKIEDCLDILDYILIMSVNPGFGGQTFIPSTLAKMNAAARIKRANTLLAADGGLNSTSIDRIFAAGVDLAIVGSDLFSADNLTEIYKELSNG